jgi:hypothetical protein
MKIQSALVRAILEKWEAYTWTVQGFGMIRTKIADVGRIHIWDSRLRVPLVSDIHEHPWRLRSTIISGELINQRFCLTDVPSLGMPYTHSRIATGEGGGLIGESTEVRLIPDRPEFYVPGCVYDQEPREIHRSIPQDGTVTLLERQMGEPLQETSVYWPRGTSWVSAEPRPAKSYEVERAVGCALARWNDA